MIEVQTLFILPNELIEIKKYFSLKEEIKSDYNFKFISVNDINLHNEIENSDIQVILLDIEIGSLKEVIKEKDNRDDYFISFSKKLKSNININNISLDTLKAYQNIASIKKLLSTYNEFDLEEKNNLDLKRDIENYLDLKIPEIILKKEEKLKPKPKTTYLEAIKIDNYFSIQNMEIDDFKGKKEIYFVGENGDGKTVLLQAILLALKGDEHKTLEYTKDYAKEIILSTKDTKIPNDYKDYRNVENIFAYGINRNKVHYTDFNKNGFSGLFDTSDSRKTTWLQEPATVLNENHNIINKFIDKLNDTIFINDLKIKKDTDNKLIFLENNKPIDFDKLSEGYKSTIIWLCDLLSRLKQNQPEIERIEEYQAIVLIDEVDLYLHPKWKYKFMHNLRSVFEDIQFIMTTHSIVTVLGASEDAVFYKVYKEDGVTKVTNQINDISNYTANILTTSPLFDLEKVTVRGFKDEKLGTDDYIYSEIHKSVREYMKDNPSSLDEQVKEKVRAELKERLAKLRKR